MATMTLYFTMQFIVFMISLISCYLIHETWTLCFMQKGDFDEIQKYMKLKTYYFILILTQTWKFLTAAVKLVVTVQIIKNFRLTKAYVL